MKKLNKKALDKALRKALVPFIVTAQFMALIGTVVMILNKKKSYAGIFAAVGFIATAAFVLIENKKRLEKKKRVLEGEEFFDFDEDEYDFFDEDLLNLDGEDLGSNESESPLEEAFSDLDEAISILENTELSDNKEEI